MKWLAFGTVLAAVLSLGYLVSPYWPKLEGPGQIRTHNMSDQSQRIEKTDAQWQAELTPEQYRVMRQKGTERAFTGEYCSTHKDGTFVCAACGQPLFDSDAKFESGTGWPSFYAPVGKDKVDFADDGAHGMRRTEILCSRCDAHLGHVFPDGPAPTGQRFCVNSASLKLVDRDKK
jgi:peptide-methionine (R)-S-oxide reductase